MIYFVETEEQLQQAYDILKTKKIIGVDTETTGLNPWKHRILLIQIGDVEHQFVIDVSKVDPSLIFFLLEKESILKVGQNLIFDYKFLAVHYGVHLENIHDCMVVDQCIELGKNLGFSMSALAKRYLSIDLESRQMSMFNETAFKSLRLEFTNHKGFFTREQIYYAAQDVVVPIQIMNKQIPIVKDNKMRNLIKLENEFTLGLGDMELNGMYLDSEEWLKVYDDNLILVEERKRRLDNYVANLPFEFPPVNWNSHKQVVELFKQLGIPTEIIDEENSTIEETVYKDSVRSIILEKYKDKFDILPLYLDYKFLFKQTSMYGEKFLRHINSVTGRVHSSYFQMKNTGRISSNKPNLQNIPREGKFRYCFKASDEDHVLICTDYDNQEARVLADRANEKVMLNFFKYGNGDLHSLTASLMFEVPVSRKVNADLRQIGKILNFLIVFGGSGFKIAKQFGIPKEKGDQFIELYYKSYPGLKPYFKKVQKATLDNGYILIDDKLNRRSYQPEWEEYNYWKELTSKYVRYNWPVSRTWWSRMYKLKGQMERNSQNYCIQGTAASISKLAIIYIRRFIRDNDLWDKFKICNMIHDEIICEVHRDIVDEAYKVIKKSMEDAAKVFCKRLDIPAEPQISKVWTH